MKVGLYSVTYLGAWYNGPALTIPEVIERARRFGYDGLELDGKRPHASPLDMSKRCCREIRERVADAGLELYAVAGNNDLSSPIPDQRESQLANIRELIRVTADLGAPVLRVFAAWPGITPTSQSARYDLAERIWNDTHIVFGEEHTWDLCRAGLKECAKWAEDEGIILALQNHPPVTNSGEAVLRFIREVGSPALKAAFDAPLARKQGVVDFRSACHPFRSLQVLTHFGGEYEQQSDGSIRGFVRHRDGSLVPEDFYAGFTAGMFDIGYRGFTGYELCHPLPKINGETAGLSFVDENVKLAVEFMKKTIERVSTSDTVADNHSNRFEADRAT
jgi:sugar phosphate isomerase/epimerase